MPSTFFRYMDVDRDLYIHTTNRTTSSDLLPGSVTGSLRQVVHVSHKQQPSCYSVAKDLDWYVIITFIGVAY